ncbi:hypothetical protein EON63_02420 [archaeon]|nr:MAG: hypothetical protein EON63_02420 [archaeon]
MTISFIHNASFMHRDIKPMNVLLFMDREGLRSGCVAKLTDFGFARGLDSQSVGPSVKGTLAYMAPEILEDSRRSSSASDVYAFSVLMNEVLSEMVPYQDMEHVTPASLIKNVKDTNLRPTLFNAAGTAASSQLLSLGQMVAGRQMLSELEVLVVRGWSKVPSDRTAMDTMSVALDELFRKEQTLFWLNSTMSVLTSASSRTTTYPSHAAVADGGTSISTAPLSGVSSSSVVPDTSEGATPVVSRKLAQKAELVTWLLQNVAEFDEDDAEECADKCIEKKCKTASLLAEVYYKQKQAGSEHAFLTSLIPAPLDTRLAAAIEKTCPPLPRLDIMNKLVVAASASVEQVRTVCAVLDVVCMNEFMRSYEKCIHDTQFMCSTCNYIYLSLYV